MPTRHSAKRTQITGDIVHTARLNQVLKTFMNIIANKCALNAQCIYPLFLNRRVESSTLSTINFSIHGSNKRFSEKLYEGSKAESSMYVVKIIQIIQNPSLK